MLIGAGLVACAGGPFKSRGLHYVARSNDFVVVEVRRGDSLRSIAKAVLGNADRAWQIADFNQIDRLHRGQWVAVPLKPTSISGVTRHGYQTVPVLCYHRFGNGHMKLSVSAKQFNQQMAYLHDNGYRVIRLEDLAAFVHGERSLPRRSVVITIDDGYRSTYEKAFPVLKKYRFPATVFLYTDFVGGGDALTWSQVEKMAKSGLIEFQPHSATHSNLAIELPDEDRSDYEKRVVNEIAEPSTAIRKHVKSPLHAYAYPYGDTNELVIQELEKHDYELGATVQPGGNPSFAYPFMLHRTMIFGDGDMEDFKQALQTYKTVAVN